MLKYCVFFVCFASIIVRAQGDATEAQIQCQEKLNATTNAYHNQMEKINRDYMTKVEQLQSSLQKAIQTGANATLTQSKFNDEFEKAQKSLDKAKEQAKEENESKTLKIQKECVGDKAEGVEPEGGTNNEDAEGQDESDMEIEDTEQEESNDDDEMDKENGVVETEPTENGENSEEAEDDVDEEEKTESKDDEDMEETESGEASHETTDSCDKRKERICKIYDAQESLLQTQIDYQLSSVDKQLIGYPQAVKDNIKSQMKEALNKQMKIIKDNHANELKKIEQHCK